MQLLTKEIVKRFEKHPFHSQEKKGDNAKVLVKFFNPYGRGTWLITEAEKQEDGDWLMFGLCHIFEWEWGYVSFNELSSVHFFGDRRIGIERDKYAEGTVKELKL